jgi:hypothetical protein
MLIPLLIGILFAHRAHGAAAGGDIVATDGTLMFRVDAATGMRSLLSDFSNAAQGPTGTSFSVAATAAGAVYVTDNAPDDMGKLFQVFADGTRIVLSDASNGAQGSPWHTPYGVAVDTDGSILVSDRGFGGGGSQAGLWRASAADGARVRLVTSGGSPESILIDSAGHILLGDAEGGTNCHTFGGCGALYRVDPVGGTLTTLSDFGNPSQGPVGEDAGRALALDVDDTILVADDFAPPGSVDCGDTVGCGVIFRWDPVGLMRTHLTEYANATQGVVGGFRPHGIAVRTDGTIFMAPCPGSGGRGGICTVNGSTGARSLFSDFGDSTQGPLGFGPISIAITEFGAISTTTTTVAVTTTTTLPGECGPRAATFDSIICRLERLVAAVEDAQDLGRLARGLDGAVTKSLAKAREAKTRADGGDAKKAKKSLKKAAHFLRGFIHRLKSLSGRKVIPPATRMMLDDAAEPIYADMKTLLGML